MGRVVVRVLWGLAYWLFSLVIAAAPVLWIPSNGLKSIGLEMFGKAYDLAFGVLFLVILAMTILTAFSYTFSLADAVLPREGKSGSPLREVIPIELPQVLIWAGFPLALAARLMAEAARNP